MQQDALTFEGGMIPQFDSIVKIPGSYLEAWNMMRDETGTMMNEHGTTRVIEFLGINRNINGMCNLGNDIIIISTLSNSNVNITEIGILNSEDVYTNVLSRENLYTPEDKLNLETKINYNGDKIIYIAGKNVKLRVINLNKIPESSIFDKSTSLFLEYALPVVEVSAPTIGGNIKSGSFQFAARLITDSNNVTPFGAVTNPMPIGVGTWGDRKDYSGADPQTPTNQAIPFTISGIDPTFPFVEPCVITYIGDSNIIRVRSLGKISTDGRASIDFVYSGEFQETGDILESQLNIDATFYEQAEYITQKDNSLLLANVQEVEDNIMWQNIANQIKISYIEHSIPVTENIDFRRITADGEFPLRIEDYLASTNLQDSVWIDRATGGSFNDYVNPEICEKFVGYKRGEVYSFTFTPIFTSGRRGDAYHIPALTPIPGSKMLKPALSVNHMYPNDFSIFSNQLVRYHKMPDNDESPFIVSNGETSILKLLGLEFELPQGEWRNSVSGYIIGRENRRGKETILCQGLLKPVYRIGDAGSTTYAPVPGVGLIQLGGPSEQDNSVNRFNKNKDHKRIFTFHAPDLILDKRTILPDKLIKVAELDGVFMAANPGQIGIGAFDQACNFVNTYISNYNKEEIPINNEIDYIESESLNTDDAPMEPSAANLTRSVTNGTITLTYRRILDCVVLNTKTDHTPINNFTEYMYHGISSIGYRLSNSTQSGKLSLYELKRDVSEFYGDIYNKESLPIIQVLFDRPFIDTISFIRQRRGEQLIPSIRNHLNPIAFGGDTYISKYAYTFKDTGPRTLSADRIPYKMSSMVYFWLESPNNYNFRHYRDVTDTNSGTLPYYPKYKVLRNENNGILDYPVSFGHSELYNRQYSAQNVIQRNYSKGVAEERITNFENRIIYSSTSIEGEKFDAFRLFLPGNYHDIPKQYGKITGIFTQGNDLFVHTERSLWKAFYNNLATQATSEGDIVLGNGGAFPRPSVLLVSNNGGYAGCLDIISSIGTPMGRYFYDANNSKLYHLSDGLREISDPYIFNFLRENAHKDLLVLGYDTGRKRILMSGKNVTLSFKPELGNYSSLHSYKFDRLISRDLTDYITLGGELRKFDSSKTGTYFDQIHPSSFKIHSVTHPSISKRYVSGTMVLTSINPLTKQNLPNAFFDKLKAYSYERNTGINNLILMENIDLEELGSVHVFKANNKFRFALPPDLVFDINENIHNAENLVTHSRFSNSDRIFLPDLIDNHMVFEFIIDNTTQKFIKLNSFIINFDLNIT